MHETILEPVLLLTLPASTMLFQRLQLYKTLISGRGSPLPFLKECLSCSNMITVSDELLIAFK